MGITLPSMLSSMENPKIEPRLLAWLQPSYFSSQSIYPQPPFFFSIQFLTDMLTYNRHKFASNVVEKSITHGSDEEKREIVKVVTTIRPDGNSPLQILMRDQYGNYVIRKSNTL